MSSDNRGKKRSYQQWKKNGSSNPQRGAPGILLTCETGREGKCRWEALQILQHDWAQNYEQEATKGDNSGHPNDSGGKVDNSGDAKDQKDNQKPTSLSLDEELAVLKHRATGKTSTFDEQFPFESYDTGVRGTVFLLCTGCQILVPPLAVSQVPRVADGGSGTKKVRLGDHNNSFQSATTSAGDTASSIATFPKTASADDCPSDDRHNIQAPSSTPVWNPLEVMRRVVEDIGKGAKGSFPSSRFITRMIPVQATCFSGVSEIQHAVGNLVRTTLQTHSSDNSNSKRTTFAIQTKIRICGHLKREQIIEFVAKQVVETAPEWTVNLSEPDFTILVEVCKNIAGVSVISSGEQLNTSTRKFNLAELRTKVSLSNDED